MEIANNNRDAKKPKPVHTNWFPTLPDRGFRPKGIVVFVVGDIVGFLSLFCVIQEHKSKLE